METRLSLFDDTITEILIGLALALLIAIAFVPELVGLPAQAATKRATTDPMDCKYICKRLDDPKSPNACSAGAGNQALSPPAKAEQCTMTCEVICKRKTEAPEPRATSLQLEDNPIFRFPALEEHRAWEIVTLWFFVCLFCVKLVHEPSVMRYHMKRIGIGPEVADASLLGNALLFGSKVLLLGSLYLFIIFVYYRGDGFVSDAIAAWGFASLLVTSFLVPNFIRYTQLLRACGNNEDNGRNWLKQGVSLWLALDLVNVIFLWVILFEPVAAGRDYLRFLSVAIAFLLLAISGLIIYALFNRAHDGIATWNWLRPWVEDVRKLKTVVKSVLCVFLLGPPLITIIARLSELPWPIAHIEHIGILVVFFINLSDWLLNRQLFFGNPP